MTEPHRPGHFTIMSWLPWHAWHPFSRTSCSQTRHGIERNFRGNHRHGREQHHHHEGLFSLPCPHPPKERYRSAAVFRSSSRSRSWVVGSASRPAVWLTTPWISRNRWAVSRAVPEISGKVVSSRSRWSSRSRSSRREHPCRWKRGEHYGADEFSEHAGLGGLAAG
jgi:hypothetical protein